jgi:hypothetical protein
LKKILSIDGGGIKGVFPASFLASIEETLGGKVAGYFDLIVGTSTGGIIALGLGLGFSAKEILAFYEERGKEIFSGNVAVKMLRRLGAAKYEREPLRRALTDIFGTRKLGESESRLVIPSFDLDTGEVHIYKTAHHERLSTDYKAFAVDVALATSAAPTYFPIHITSSGQSLADGGLWANNPMGLAVVEGIGMLSWPRDEIRLLSLGCTEEKLDMGYRNGALPWLFNLEDVVLAAQSSAAIGTAQLLIGHANVRRINPHVPNKRFGLDLTKRIGDLKGLGYSEARKAYPDIRDLFIETVDSFEPAHKL